MSLGQLVFTYGEVFNLQLVFVASGNLLGLLAIEIRCGLLCLSGKIDLVFFAYCGKSSCSFLFTCPPVWKLDLVFVAHGSPTVSKKTNTSIVSKKDASFFCMVLARGTTPISKPRSKILG